MKRLAAICVLSAVLCIGVMGCGGEEASTSSDSEVSSAGGPPDVTTARKIQDDAPKFNPMQMNCIVCGERPIKGEFHADVSAGGRSGRIYFDKKECLEKFNNNKEKYLGRLTE